jgi:hypothetical protein
MKYETVIFCLITSQDFQKIKVKVKVKLFDLSEIDFWARVLGLRHQPTDVFIGYDRSSEHHYCSG